MLYTVDGKRLDDVRIPGDANNNWEFRGISPPTLTDSSLNANFKVQVEVKNGPIVLHKSSEYAHLTEDKKHLDLRIKKDGVETKLRAEIQPPDTYINSDTSDGSDFRSISDKQIVVTMKATIHREPYVTGTSWHTFVVADGIAQRLVSPIEFTHATYVDEKYILGWATDTMRMEFGTPSPEVRPRAENPFVCRISDLSITILKRLVMKQRWARDLGMTEKLSIEVHPRTIDSTGTLVLCDRRECIRAPRPYGGEYKYNVVLFRKGQAEVIKKVMVQGVSMTPIRVISARGSFAILEGRDPKGQIFAFTYHLQ